MASTEQFDVIVIGGGLAGLAFACALRDSGRRIALVEEHPPARPADWDPRVYAISPASAAFLDRIGAWRTLDASRRAAVRTMEIFGDAGARLSFSAYEAGVDELAWIAESAPLACELWENLRRHPRLTLACPARPHAVSIGPERAVLDLSDGRRLAAPLLVGADGRDSWLRRAVGIGVEHQDYGEQGVVAHFACARPHRGVARQWFRDDGVLAWLPLGDDGISRISIVWSTPDAHAAELLALPAEDFARRVAEAGGQALGALELIAPPAAFPLRLSRVAQAVVPRVALIGDAAHGIHPLSGHGINLGFQDARSLAETIAATPDWQDIGNLRVLSRHARSRHEETLLLQYTTHTMHWLFREKLAGLKSLRNLGLELTDRLSPVKTLLVRYAIGPT